MTRPAVLFALHDIPGYFFPLAYDMAARLVADGVPVIFALTARYYQVFKEVDLDSLGPVHVLSEHLASTDRDEDPVDWWHVFPTFTRTEYYNFRHTNAWADYGRTARFFRRVFDSAPIGAVYSEAPSSAFLYLCYDEAERRGIPFLGYLAGRLPAHFYVPLDPHESRFIQNPAPTSAADADKGPPDYMRVATNNLAEYSLVRELPRLARQLVKALRAPRDKSLEIGPPLAYQLYCYARLVERKLQCAWVKTFHDVFEPTVHCTPRETWVVHPLQDRPEAATSVYARHYGDDFELVRNIAFSLPQHARLVVKEHQSCLGKRGAAFYRAVRALPNVTLLDVSYPLRDNLNRFDAVVTLSSTVGFEALMVGVPAYVLGSCFYRNYPGAIPVDGWADLEAKLSRITKNVPGDYGPAALDSYLSILFRGNYNYMDANVMHPRNVELLLEPLRLTLASAQRA